MLYKLCKVPRGNFSRKSDFSRFNYADNIYLPKTAPVVTRKLELWKSTFQSFTKPLKILYKSFTRLLQDFPPHKIYKIYKPFTSLRILYTTFTRFSTLQNLQNLQTVYTFYKHFTSFTNILQWFTKCFKLWRKKGYHHLFSDVFQVFTRVLQGFSMFSKKFPSFFQISRKFQNFTPVFRGLRIVIGKMWCRYDFTLPFKIYKRFTSAFQVLQSPSKFTHCLQFSIWKFVKRVYEICTRFGNVFTNHESPSD